MFSYIADIIKAYLFNRLCHVILTVHFIENNLLLTLKVFDPGEVLYIYESPAGIGISVLRVIVSITY